jgi:hypothetical protein
MAYKERASDELTGGLLDGEVNHFWAIHKSVGWGCHNKTDDVMLVQYLINVWAKGKVLEMDGIFGNKTYNGIKRFQQWMNSIFGPNMAKTDGKVTASDGDADFVTKSNTFYTIHLLNHVLLDQRKIYYSDLRMDSLLPPLLCTVLSAAGSGSSSGLSGGKVSVGSF